MTTLSIDIRKIEQNTRLVADLLGPLGIRLVGVTKACLGNERVGAAMLAGGAGALADSRPESIDNLRRFLPDVELSLMRPQLEEAGSHLAASNTVFFVSTSEQARALLGAGSREPGSSSGAGETPLRICLMIETGDGREGVPAPLAGSEARRIASLDGVELAGLATNAACARPGAPLQAAMETFSATAAEVMEAVGGSGCLAAGQPPILSAGGSGLLRLLYDGGDPSGSQVPASSGPLGTVTELRVGEAILLGRIPSGSHPGLYLPGSHRDAFMLEAPILEVFEKGGRAQALVGFGVQDVGHSPLVPLQEGVSPAKITSDYFAVNLSPEARKTCRVGERLAFIAPYYGLLAAMTSPYVEKDFTK